MKCNKCGFEMATALGKFCPNCGEKIFVESNASESALETVPVEAEQNVQKPSVGSKAKYISLVWTVVALDVALIFHCAAISGPRFAYIAYANLFPAIWFALAFTYQKKWAWKRWHPLGLVAPALFCCDILFDKRFPTPISKILFSLICIGSLMACRGHDESQKNVQLSFGEKIESYLNWVCVFAILYYASATK